MSPGVVAPRPDAAPRLAGDVVLHPPQDDGGWFVQRGSAQYFSVEPDLARLLGLLDGHRDPDELAAELGAPWSADVVDATLQQVGAAGLLATDDGGRRRRSARPARIRYVPPFTVQLTLFRPGPQFVAIASRLAGIDARVGAVVCGSLGAAGIVALALQWRDVLAALGRPQPYAAVLFVFFAVLATTAVHELAHGVLLAARGGRPSRLGVMLFYLMPAFFCDVSDGWRLKSARARVDVALAGIAVQVAVAGAAGITALAAQSSVLAPGLVLFSISSFVASAANAIPFVKLDGYIALMNHVGVSFLRDKAMDDARAEFTHRVLRAPETPRNIERPWTVPFGVACMVFPVVLTVQAIVIWADLFDRAGVVGAVLLATLLSLVVWRAGVVVRTVLVRAWRDGASRARVVLAGVLLVAALGMVAVIPVPDRVVGGYATDETGEAQLVLPRTSDLAALTPGTSVVLMRSGLVLGSPTGEAEVGPGSRVSDWVPAAALLPVTDEYPLVPATLLPLDGVMGRPDRYGTAVIEVGQVPLVTWIYERTLGKLSN